MRENADQNNSEYGRILRSHLQKKKNECPSMILLKIVHVNAFHEIHFLPSIF